MAKNTASQHEKGAISRLRLFRKARLWLRGANRWRVSKILDFKIWGRGIKNLWRPVKEIIQEKHRFVVMDSKTYKEKISFQLSGINLFVTIGISVIVLVVLTSLLISFTSLREFIPGYANTDMVEQTYRNAQVIDSLERQIDNQAYMIQTIQQILNGEEMPGEEVYANRDTATKVMAVSYTHSKADSILRRDVEREDNKYQVKQPAYDHRESVDEGSGQMHTVSERIGLGAHLLFPPLKGKVIAAYDTKINHYGVDIAGLSNASIVAIYSGTVIFSNYTVEAGYVIAIQHSGNVISVYKHCSALLKQQGNVVRVGEPIAYLGNSGKFTTGPHLHFEIWIAGNPVDPTQYISF